MMSARIMVLTGWMWAKSLAVNPGGGFPIRNVLQVDPGSNDVFQLAAQSLDRSFDFIDDEMSLCNYIGSSYGLVTMGSGSAGYQDPIADYEWPG